MRRGNDMHLELKLTMHGEPLPRKEKEQLAAGIAAATVRVLSAFSTKSYPAIGMEPIEP